MKTLIITKVDEGQTIYKYLRKHLSKAPLSFIEKIFRLKDVKINKLAIAQGNLTIRISDIPIVSQPLPFSEGETVVGINSIIDVEESVDSKLSVLDTGVNLQELVNGLNALGVSPRDLISILQAIKASGALQADIEVI